MSELRKDPLVDRWVIISPRRGKRPSDFQTKGGDPPPPGESCAFCPGREQETGPEVYAIRDSEHAEPNIPGWKVRVIHNKYPAVSTDRPRQDEGSVKPWPDEEEGGVYSGCVLEGFGSHEVVIETSEHITTFAGLPVDQTALVFKAFRSRLQQFRADPRFQACQVFKNHGNKAGASMRHSHSQIVALPVIPRNLQTQMEGAECFYQRNQKKCALCLTLRHDCSVRKRVIDENESFLSAAPFAPRFPYETWIIPKRHMSDFDSMEDGEVEGLAAIMKLTLQKMDMAFTYPPYNYMLHTAPLIPEYYNVPYYHWHIQIVPHLVEMGGFELGSGCHINSVFPETAAELLRTIVIQPYMVFFDLNDCTKDGWNTYKVLCK